MKEVSFRYRVLRSYGIDWLTALVMAKLNDWKYGPSDGFPVEVRFMTTMMEFQTWGWRK